jgi:hypothetical protein
MASVVVLGKRSGERCNSFPMPRIRNLQEITGELQEHPLADALLALVRLLIGDPDQVGHLLLGQAEHNPALAHPRADMAVDILWPRSAYHLRNRHRSLSSARDRRVHPLPRPGLMKGWRHRPQERKCGKATDLADPSVPTDFGRLLVIPISMRFQRRGGASASSRPTAA